MRTKTILPLFLAVTLLLCGCERWRKPAKPAYRPPVPVQQQRPPVQQPAYVPPYIPPAPPPPVGPATPSIPSPVSPPVQAAGWVDTVSRRTVGGLQVSIVPDKVSPMAAARITWRTTDPVTQDSYFVGVNKDGALVVVDYSNAGVQGAVTDQFRSDLETVATWKIIKSLDL